jgi:hypothetical protein
VTPEAGKRYRIEVEVEVASVSPAGNVVGLRGGEVDKDWFGAFMDRACWQALAPTEVEPEYVVGGLYVDADDLVWKRVDCSGGPWMVVNTGRICSESVPPRPLTRLYREGEAR